MQASSKESHPTEESLLTRAIGTHLRVSGTMQIIESSIGGGSISGLTLAKAILQLREHYASSVEPAPHSSPRTGVELKLSQWLTDVRLVVSRDSLHSRHVLLGLWLLDDAVRANLGQQFIAKLWPSGEKVESSLTEHGKMLWRLIHQTPENVPMSPGLQAVLSKAGDRAISAFTFAKLILTYFGRYGGNTGTQALSVLESESVNHEKDSKRHPLDWLATAMQLVVPPEGLNGRIALYCLALKDENLREQLEANAFLSKLRAEHRPRIDTFLTEQGRKLDRVLNVREQDDVVYIQSDHPISSSHSDSLARKPFADLLVSILRDNSAREQRLYVSRDPLPEDGSLDELIAWFKKQHAPKPVEDQSFVMHLDGHWGSGKSTILTLMKQNLQGQTRDPWIVVEFNAWQHQRFRPSWWHLIQTVYTQANGQLKALQADPLSFAEEHRWRLLLCEWSWRLKPAVFEICAVLVAAVIFFTLITFHGISFTPDESMQKAFSGINAAIAAFVVLLGLFQGFKNSIWTTSIGAAKKYMEGTSDPLDELSKHFQSMISEIHFPVAIFVDDLDRCSAEYTIELLEGIHTLMRRAGVSFVIAADRRWLYSCFENVYAPFADVATPSRPLGHLFLEKTFQLSASVPRMTEASRARYWDTLLRGTVSANGDSQTAFDATSIIRNIKDDRDLRAVQKEMQRAGAAPETIAEAASQALQKKEVKKAMAHRLHQFAHLVEPNPRSMKRLINAYAIQRQANVMNGSIVEPEVLVLWTILSLRWPNLAKLLESTPEEADKFTKDTRSSLIGTKFPELLLDDDLLRVLKGDRTDFSLTTRDIIDCLTGGVKETVA